MMKQELGENNSALGEIFPNQISTFPVSIAVKGIASFTLPTLDWIRVYRYRGFPLERVGMVLLQKLYFVRRVNSSVGIEKQYRT